MSPAAKRGRPQKLGDHQSYTLRLPADLHRQLRHLAVDQGKSLNDILLMVIESWWEKQPERAAYARLPEGKVRRRGSRVKDTRQG